MVRKVDWDVFISHASEDKPFVGKLASALKQKGLQVWYDEFTLTVGDSLRRSIEQGLVRSRYGVVVLSPNFFAKEWPQWELDGLAALEIPSGRKVILPVWHNITANEIRKYSPLLADRIAVSSNRGLTRVVTELLRAMEPGEPPRDRGAQPIVTKDWLRYLVLWARGGLPVLLLIIIVLLSQSQGGNDLTTPTVALGPISILSPSTVLPTPTATSLLMAARLPTNTSTSAPTWTPTNTPIPPTDTPLPTSTSTDIPTATISPIPTKISTNTPTPASTILSDTSAHTPTTLPSFSKPEMVRQDHLGEGSFKFSWSWDDYAKLSNIPWGYEFRFYDGDIVVATDVITSNKATFENNLWSYTLLNSEHPDWDWSACPTRWVVVAALLNEDGTYDKALFSEETILSIRGNFCPPNCECDGPNGSGGAVIN